MIPLFKVIGSAVIAAAMVWGALLVHPITTQTPAPTQSFGSAFSPVQGSTYVLAGAGINSSVTTITLTSFKTPDGRSLTMGMFGTIGYASVDPNSPSKIEDITFTGITQNANGSAVLTGVSRGMDFVSPYTSSTSLAYAHAGGAYLILSNTAGFYGQQFLFANSVSTSSASLVFSSTSPPYYDGTVTFSNPFSLIDKQYADALSIAGSPTSTFSGMGQTQLATKTQIAAGTASSTIGAPLVLPAIFATSTPNASFCGAGCIPVTNSTGFLSSLFISTTSAYSWTGNQTFAKATSTAFGVSGSVLGLNGLFYTFPSSQGAANTNLTNDGTGILTWNNRNHSVATSTTQIVLASSVSSTTLASFTLPANQLANGEVLRVTFQLSAFGTVSTDTFQFCVKYGGSTNSFCGIALNGTAFSTGDAQIVVNIFGKTSATQQVTWNTTAYNSGGVSVMSNGAGSIATDATSAQTVLISIKENTSNAGDKITMENYVAEIIAR